MFNKLKKSWRLQLLKKMRFNIRHPIQSLQAFFGYPLFPMTYKCFLLQKYGTVYLADVLELCENLNMKPFLTFGTLLGYYRDGGFIKHDSDIDLGMLEKDFSRIECLEKVMCKKGYIVRLKNPHEISFYKQHQPSLVIDIFLFERTSEKVFYRCKDSGVTGEFGFRKEIFDNFSEIQFRGIAKVAIPTLTEEFLETSYGNWRIPVKIFDCLYDHPNVSIFNGASLR